jgi:capsular exopolysaccharide synthesis family protein
MERIQAALERLKEQQGKGAKSAQTAKHGPASIVYTRTRSVDVPLDRLRGQRVLSAFEEGPFTDAYKLLRTQVMHRMREQGWNVLAVTSPGEGEGKTLTAVNLAISLAMEVTQTVLLVDSDLRHPRIHEIFGIEEGNGLADYLLDDARVEDLLVHPGIGRFVLFPGGRSISHSAEALSSPKMVALVDELRYRYPLRFVLFDLPPVLSTADALAFSPYVDAALLVVEEGRTKVEEVERALQLLQPATPVIGTVLNKAGRPPGATGETRLAPEPEPKRDERDWLEEAAG